jgi:hypothetical protein
MRQSFVTRCLYVVILGGILFLPVATAQAQVAAKTTAQLAREADVVAVGHVSSMISEWNDTRTSIRTRVTIAVSEFVKGGEPGSSLTLYVPGGEVGTVGELYSDMPVFHRDEDVVVFAQRTPQGAFRVAGGSLGKYSVTRDAATGREVVSNRLSLNDFAAQIRAALQAGPSK